MFIFNKNYKYIKIKDGIKNKVIYKYSINKDKTRNINCKRSLIIKIIDIIIFILILHILYSNRYSLLSLNKGKYIHYLNETFDSRNIAFDKALNFIKNCLSSDILTFQSSFLYKDPKVSVVIPTFNCEKFILRAIKSIQYQNFSNIEIILVDDKSTDNTINLVKKIQDGDYRIKILQNEKNMGILYSRSVGVIYSKGKYIFTLDNDDLFLNNDIFDTCINLAEEGNFDLIEFMAISNRIKNDNLLTNKIKDSKFSHSEQIILFQPELGRYPIPTGESLGSYGLKDIFLWGKCIKSEIYKNALNKLGVNRYTRFMIRYEDILTNYMIFNTARSFIFIKKYGIYHIERNGSATAVGRKKVSRNTNLLYLLDIVIDFSQNNINNKKLVVHLIIYFLTLKNIKRTLISNDYNMKLIISCIKRILNSKNISDKYKTIVKNVVKKCKFIKNFD